MYDIRKKFGIGNLVTNAIEKAVDAGILNPNSNSLQDYASFVVTNPDLVDEDIDVSGLRTQTDTSPYLLGNIPNYSGIQYEAYNPNRLSDLMRLYSGGLPTFDTDTAQIPGAIDTLVNAGDGDAAPTNFNPISTPINTPITTDLTDDQINEFATEDTTMPPMLSPDMIGDIDTTPVDPATTTVLGTKAPDGTTMADMTDDVDLDFFESQMQSNQQQTPPGGGDPEMFYDAPETYSPISPGLDDLLDDATLTSAQAPVEQAPPGIMNPYDPSQSTFLGANPNINKGGLEDLLDQAEATDAEIYGEPLDAEDYLGTSTPQEINIDTQVVSDPSMVQDPLDIPTQNVGLAYTGEFDPNDEGTVFDTDVVTQEDIQDDRGLLQKLGLPEDFDLKKAGIELGINYMVGAPVSLIARALEALPPSASQLAYDAYTPTQQSIIDQEFGPGGLLDGYNKVSMFGKDAKGIAEERLNQRLGNVGIDQRTLDLANLVESLGGDVPNSVELTRSGDIQDTGDASVAEEIAAADRAAAQAAAEAAELDRQNREADAAQAAADRAAEAQAAAEAAERDRQQREADIAEAAQAAAAQVAAEAAERDRQNREADAAQAAANREAARTQDNSPGNPANQSAPSNQANSPGNPANQGQGEGGDGGNGGGNGGGGTHVCTASYANNLITTLDFKSLKKYGIKLRRNDKYLMKAYDWFGPKLAAAVKKGKLVNFAKHSTSMWKYEQTKEDVSFKIKFMSKLHKIITRPILRALGALLTIKEKLTK